MNGPARRDGIAVADASDGAVAVGKGQAAALRRWLRRIDRPEELAVPELADLLRRHDRLPASRSPAAIGQAAAQLLTEAVERLRAPTTASRHQQLPYVVLKACFFDRSKRFTAGAQLGMSERQVTRELARALQLLEAELWQPMVTRTSGPRAEPVPRISGFVSRPALTEQLGRLVDEHRLVHVHGARGAGKTSLVAEYASSVEQEQTVIWYQLRAGLNTTLSAFLFDLVDCVRDRLSPEQVDAVTAAVTSDDLGMATRLALQALRDQALLFVVDDFHLSRDEEDQRLSDFLDELAHRSAHSAIITISRQRPMGKQADRQLDVTPMTVAETQALLETLRLVATDDLAAKVHRWTNGLPQLVTFAASWLKTATPAEMARGLDRMLDLDDVQEFLLANITDLIDPEDRHVLAAASVFRDRFTDDAVGFVAERSRGQVLDTSRRLVRHYLATRARDGEVAFFHESVREFVQARLNPEQRNRFHERAAQWFERVGDPDEARYHEERASTPIDILLPAPSRSRGRG